MVQVVNLYNMATLETMTSKLTELTGGVDIPGLDLKSVETSMVENNPDCMASIDSLPTESEKKAKKEELVSYFMDKGKVSIESNISTIKASAATLKTGIPQTTKSIGEVSIAVGVPTSAPAALPLVSQLKCNVDNLKNICVAMIVAALAISFVLPDALLAMVSSVMGLYVLISKIPI